MSTFGKPRWCPVHERYSCAVVHVTLRCSGCNDFHTVENRGQLPPLCTSCVAKNAERIARALDGDK